MALDLGAARFLAYAEAQAHLLLVLVHLDDLEVVLRVILQLHRNVVLVDGLRDLAQALDALGDLNERAELRRPQNLAPDHVAHAMLCEERIPNIRLQLLDAQ